ncbi:MAG: TetR/AcrR family transcriptional regulator [Acidimicrobiales bacterium]
MPSEQPPGPDQPSALDAKPGRQRVLDAAAARLVEQGYAATTLRQVAGDAGIKAGSIYHYFPSKEELFTAVLRDGIGVMVTAFDASEPGLRSHVRAHLGALFEHGPYTAAHVTAFFTAPPAIRTATVPVRDGYEALWNSLLEELLPHLDPKQVSLHRLLLFGAMNTTIEWFDPKGNVTLDQLAEAITDQFLNGVGRERS